MSTTAQALPLLVDAGWIDETRRALAAADDHPQYDRAEYVAGGLVNFVRTRETEAARAERRHWADQIEDALGDWDLNVGPAVRDRLADVLAEMRRP